MQAPYFDQQFSAVFWLASAVQPNTTQNRAPYPPKAPTLEELAAEPLEVHTICSLCAAIQIVPPVNIHSQCLLPIPSMPCPNTRPLRERVASLQPLSTALAFTTVLGPCHSYTD